MAVADKTYSFRAPSAFDKRLQQVQGDFSAVTRDAELSAHLGNEFELALIRRLRKLGENIPSGVFLRALAEAFVSAIERVRWEQEHMEEFAAFGREDSEGEAWRRAAVGQWAARIADDDAA